MHLKARYFVQPGQWTMARTLWTDRDVFSEATMQCGPCPYKLTIRHWEPCYEMKGLRVTTIINNVTLFIPFLFISTTPRIKLDLQTIGSSPAQTYIRFVTKFLPEYTILKNTYLLIKLKMKFKCHPQS